MPGTRTKPVETYYMHEDVDSRVLEIRREGPRSSRSDWYLVLSGQSDFGRAFRLVRISGPDRAAYSVCLEEDGTGHCDCLGALHTGSCKHIRALEELIARGEI